jgi:predicted transcriptional regulator
MKVLLSIKPQFADLIFAGSKKYEFRRAIFKNPYVTRIVVYASSQVQKVIGEFEIDHILKSDVEALWGMTYKHSGISEQYFKDYFTGKIQGFAIAVKNPKLYRSPKCIRKDYKAFPPQSFLYLPT